ncbi:MAG: Mur ligase family protein, partial [Nitrospirota bacterium]
MRRKVWTEIKDKKITVVGLGRSGIGAANLLSELRADVTVTDVKTEDGLKDFIARLKPSVRLALGGHPEDIFVSTDMLVISPGVPPGIPPVACAKSKDIPIIGELELAYQILNSKLVIPPAPPLEKGGWGDLKKGGKFEFLAVTGTNGKSTTTALLDFMMKKGGFRTILGGNIGNALTEEILKLVKSQESIVSSQKTLDSPASLRKAGQARLSTLDYLVAEVSSFQLESIKDFRPKVAA